LRQAGFGEANHLGTLHAKECFQLGRCVFLDDGIMSKVGQDLRAAAFGNIRGDEHEVQLALAAVQRVAADEQSARLYHEWK